MENTKKYSLLKKRHPFYTEQASTPNRSKDLFEAGSEKRLSQVLDSIVFTTASNYLLSLESSSIKLTPLSSRISTSQIELEKHETILKRGDLNLTPFGDNGFLPNFRAIDPIIISTGKKQRLHYPKITFKNKSDYKKFLHLINTESDSILEIYKAISENYPDTKFHVDSHGVHYITDSNFNSIPALIDEDDPEKRMPYSEYLETLRSGMYLMCFDLFPHTMINGEIKIGLFPRQTKPTPFPYAIGGRLSKFNPSNGIIQPSLDIIKRESGLEIPQEKINILPNPHIENLPEANQRDLNETQTGSFHGTFFVTDTIAFENNLKLEPTEYSQGEVIWVGLSDIDRLMDTNPQTNVAYTNSYKEKLRQLILSIAVKKILPSP
jgi:hypothetical protein